jgi:hypothetical protein
MASDAHVAPHAMTDVGHFSNCVFRISSSAKYKIDVPALPMSQMVHMRIVRTQLNHQSGAATILLVMDKKWPRSNKVERGCC